jgi:hypothetical protein
LDAEEAEAAEAEAEEAVEAEATAEGRSNKGVWPVGTFCPDTV